MRAAFLTIVILIILAIIGWVAWVHFYYLPYTANPPSPVMGNYIPGSTSVASPKTAEAIQTIQYLVQQHYLPILNAKPAQLTLATFPSTESTTLSYLGLTLSVPWTGITKTTQKGNPPGLVEVDFDNGRSISIMRGMTSGTSTLVQWNSVSSSIRTDYDLDVAALNATPAEVISSTPEDQAVLIASLLTLKTSIWSPGPVYIFRTGTVEGFQHGDASTTRPSGIDLYDSDSNPYILIVKGTQQEINYILASAK